MSIESETQLSQKELDMAKNYKINENQSSVTPEALRPIPVDNKKEREELTNKFFESYNDKVRKNLDYIKENKLNEIIRKYEETIKNKKDEFTEKELNPHIQESMKKYFEKSLDALLELRNNNFIDQVKFEDEIKNLKESKNLSNEQEYNFDKNLIEMVKKINLVNNKHGETDIVAFKDLAPGRKDLSLNDASSFKGDRRYIENVFNQHNAYIENEMKKYNPNHLKLYFQNAITKNDLVDPKKAEEMIKSIS